MFCDICRKNEARITYTEVINGEKREQHLCQSCAAEQSSLLLKNRLGSDISIGNILSGLLSNYAKGMIAKHASEPVCLRCGMTVSEFLKTGRLGCPECYSSFASILEKNINAVQNSTQHTGKVPGYAIKFKIKSPDAEGDSYGISHAEEVFREAVSGSSDGKAPNMESAETGRKNTGSVNKAAEAGSGRNTEAKNGRSRTPDKKSADGTKAADRRNVMAEKIADMRRKLTAAVAEEDYEKAARLRDGIRNLEQMAEAVNAKTTEKPATEKTKSKKIAAQKPKAKKAAAEEPKTGKETAQKPKAKQVTAEKTAEVSQAQKKTAAKRADDGKAGPASEKENGKGAQKKPTGKKSDGSASKKVNNENGENI